MVKNKISDEQQLDFAEELIGKGVGFGIEEIIFNKKYISSVRVAGFNANLSAIDPDELSHAFELGAGFARGNDALFLVNKVMKFRRDEIQSYSIRARAIDFNKAKSQPCEAQTLYFTTDRGLVIDTSKNFFEKLVAHRCENGCRNSYKCPAYIAYKEGKVKSYIM
ncbi:MAG: hypothetical protein NTY99_02030 [DPANN group archaeon]|nr:hypothetical protein [DPANN group archaeon]